MSDSDLNEALATVNEIRAAIHDLHLSLDLRENGHVAAWNAIHKIERILDIPQWEAGAEQARRAEKIRSGK